MWAVGQDNPLHLPLLLRPLPLLLMPWNYKSSLALEDSKLPDARSGLQQLLSGLLLVVAEEVNCYYCWILDLPKTTLSPAGTLTSSDGYEEGGSMGIHFAVGSNIIP